MIKNLRVENNEILCDGQVKEFDIYKDFCCDGFGWEVLLIIGCGNDKSIWGHCKNPDCPIIESGFTKETDMYHGVSDFCESDFLELLLNGCHIGDSKIEKEIEEK